MCIYGHVPISPRRKDTVFAHLVFKATGTEPNTVQQTYSGRVPLIHKLCGESQSRDPHRAAVLGHGSKGKLSSTISTPLPQPYFPHSEKNTKVVGRMGFKETAQSFLLIIHFPGIASML